MDFSNPIISTILENLLLILAVKLLLFSDFCKTPDEDDYNLDDDENGE